MPAFHHRRCFWLTGAFLAASAVPLSAQQGTGMEEQRIAPRERSTPESIQFAPVDEEQLGETSIQGALGPPSSGLVGPETDVLVEPVYLSDELRRALDMERGQLERQREQLIGPLMDRPPMTPQVQYPGFQNRTYEPGSRTSTRFRE